MSTPDAAPAPAEAIDPSILRAERRLRLLEELSEIGMDLARALRHEVLARAEQAENIANGEAPPAASPAAAGKAPDPADTFARISRAIRLTLTLEAKTDEALRALRAGLPAEIKTRRVEAVRRATVEAEKRGVVHRAKVRRLVVDVVDREVESPDAHDDLTSALDERLEYDEAYADLERLPLCETVQKLCNDLQLTPDLRRWTGEGWAPEPFFRSKCSPFWRPGRKPLDDDDEPDPANLE